ncbi:MAG: hypothetical protein WBA17_01120 [Saprospiraceae bacterium]
MNFNDLDLILDYCETKYKYIGKGHTRLVYKSKHNVIKVPINDRCHQLGRESNSLEYYVFQNLQKHTGIFAKCKLVYLKSIPIIVMELVDKSHFNSIPTYNITEGNQIGFNHNHKAVIYDYGEYGIYQEFKNISDWHIEVLKLDSKLFSYKTTWNTYYIKHVSKFNKLLLLDILLNNNLLPKLAFKNNVVSIYLNTFYMEVVLNKNYVYIIHLNLHLSYFLFYFYIKYLFYKYT